MSDLSKTTAMSNPETTGTPQTPSHSGDLPVVPLASAPSSIPSTSARDGSPPDLPGRSVWEWCEVTGKRFGWMISTASVIIAIFALNTTLKKNGRDTQAAVTAQRQSSIVQALSTLQTPSAPGTSFALELIAQERVPVNGLHLEGAYLQYANLSNLKAHDAVFDRADLNGVNFRGAEISNSSFIGVEMSGGNLRRIGQPPTPTRSVQAEFRVIPKEQRDPRRVIESDLPYRMDFSKSNLRGAAFDYAVIPNSLFRGAHLEGTTFIGAHLAGTDFVDADMTNTDLTGAKLGSGLSASNITQHQLDVACAASDRPPSIPDGMHPPLHVCP